MSDTTTEMLVREADVLADCFEDVRGLLKFYLSRATDLDPHRAYEFEGKRLNTLYWLTAHLTWAEHFLLIEAMGGDALDIPWLTKFELGSEPPSGEGLPTYEEVRETLDRVHKQAMTTLRALSSHDLGQPNPLGLSFRGGDTRRVVARHAIRHEPCHIGQVGWVLKLAGVETV